MSYNAVVIGASAGGMDALRKVLEKLPANFPLPVLVVQHMGPLSENYLTIYLNNHCNVVVKEADEKEIIQPGIVYIAPPNYHLLVEKDKKLSLSTEGKVNYARPSIDVLFETAADAYGCGLIGIILTGANSDGSLGLQRIKEHGGLTIVQDPLTAEVDSMPKAAIKNVKVDYILSLDRIGEFINRIVGE